MLRIQNVLLSIECHYLLKRCQVYEHYLAIAIVGVFGLNFQRKALLSLPL
jgi:hypothetical protein